MLANSLGVSCGGNLTLSSFCPKLFCKIKDQTSWQTFARALYSAYTITHLILGGNNGLQNVQRSGRPSLVRGRDSLRCRNRIPRGRSSFRVRRPEQSALDTHANTYFVKYLLTNYFVLVILCLTINEAINMRTYTFRRECGHTVRGTNKAKSLARPCNDCILRILESESLPRGFHFWSESLQTKWIKDKLNARVRSLTVTTCQTLNQSTGRK